MYYTQITQVKVFREAVHIPWFLKCDYKIFAAGENTTHLLSRRAYLCFCFLYILAIFCKDLEGSLMCAILRTRCSQENICSIFLKKKVHGVLEEKPTKS